MICCAGSLTPELELELGERRYADVHDRMSGLAQGPLWAWRPAYLAYPGRSVASSAFDTADTVRSQAAVWRMRISRTERSTLTASPSAK